MQDRQEGKIYEAALNTAIFLSSLGNYELAMEVTLRALERLHLENETNLTVPKDNEHRRSIEIALTQKYLAFRSKIEAEKSPHRKTLIKTLIICGIISISIVFTTSIVVRQLKSLIEKPTGMLVSTVQESIRTEVPKLTSDVRAQIPILAQTVKDEIPKISSRLTEKIDEKLSKAIRKEVESVVDDKLPKIIELKLRNISEEKKK